MTEGHIATGTANGDYKLPEGWLLPRVGELLRVNYGKGLPEKRRLPGKVPVYGSNGVIGYHSKSLTRGPTIIVGRKGTVGAVHLSQEPCWPIDTTYFIEQFNGLHPGYVYHGLTSLNLAGLDTSTAIPGLNRDELYDERLPVAPLAEEKRIVAKIEQLFARVNATRERLAKVPPILKRFRQAVLAAACSGRLTEDWRTQHVAESGSIETDGSNIRESPRTPVGWRWLTIDKLSSSLPRSIQSGPFGSNLHHSEFQETGVLAIGIDNVMAGKFAMGKEHRISEEKYKELEKYRARPLDVLITVMATVGRCCVIPEDVETAIITKHVYRITPNRKIVNPHYLMYSLLGDPTVQSQIQGQIRGQTRPGINGKILKAISLAMPPLSEQDEIVRRVHALLELADKIDGRVTAARHKAEGATQAILAKAFRGKLVATEAELASREGRAYETASELLSRIAQHPKPPSSRENRVQRTAER